jgi:hypothetical protein
VSGCRDQLERQPLSERFNVCASLPTNSVYRTHRQWIDFDTGTLEVDGVFVDVEIGGHPRFSQRVKKTGEGATTGFRFLGKERSDDREKLLFGHERRDGQGPVFVMLSAPNLQKVEQTLTAGSLLSDCDE